MARASQVGQAVLACPTCGLTANSTTSGVLTFEVAPAAAIADGGPVSSIAAQIRIRLSQYWPELAAGLAKRRLSRRKLPH